jgi:hypothetical protein
MPIGAETDVARKRRRRCVENGLLDLALEPASCVEARRSRAAGINGMMWMRCPALKAHWSEFPDQLPVGRADARW